MTNKRLYSAITLLVAAFVFSRSGRSRADGPDDNYEVGLGKDDTQQWLWIRDLNGYCDLDTCKAKVEDTCHDRGVQVCQSMGLDFSGAWGECRQAPDASWYVACAPVMCFTYPDDALAEADDTFSADSFDDFEHVDTCSSGVCQPACLTSEDPDTDYF